MMSEVDAIARRAWGMSEALEAQRATLRRRLRRMAGRLAMRALIAYGIEPTEREAEALIEGDPYVLDLAAKIVATIESDRR